MSKFNVFILSAGRRVELINLFKKTASKINDGSIILAGDASETAPALYFADKYVKLPRVTEKEYISSIIEISLKEKISLIVPTIDNELQVLSRNKDIIEQQTSAKVLISSPEVIDICSDKVKTQRYLEKHDFKMPKMYEENELSSAVNYPLFIKPKSGSSSINTFKVNSEKELSLYRNLISDPIIQDYIEGEEYSVDVFLDFKGEVISIVPRLRIQTRSGEISKGKIIKDQDIIRDVKQLMKKLKPIGHITAQLMKTDRGIEYIEINPRFGGGAPMSIQSGADSPQYLLDLLIGKELEYTEEYHENQLFLRFDQSICLNENMELLE